MSAPSSFPLLLAGSLLLCSVSAAAEQSFDVVVYGGTSAAVTAAVQARQMGKTVVVVSPDKHLGGLSSGGLGWTDSGNKEVVGGLARQFYHRVWKRYQQPEAWRWQQREAYGNRGQGTSAMDQNAQTMWIFEPHVAEATFDAWINGAGHPGRARRVAGSRPRREAGGESHRVIDDSRRTDL